MFGRLAELLLLVACGGVAAGLMLKLRRIPPATRLAASLPVAGGLFFAFLGAGRLLGVPGFAPPSGDLEPAMTVAGLAVWAASVRNLLRKR
jgi:hypothetical protein